MSQKKKKKKKARSEFYLLGLLIGKVSYGKVGSRERPQVCGENAKGDPGPKDNLDGLQIHSLSAVSAGEGVCDRGEKGRTRDNWG